MADVIRSKRQVISGKLLAALDDESKVGVILTRADCEMIEETLEYFARVTRRSHAVKCREFAADLKQLREAAFGPR